MKLALFGVGRIGQIHLNNIINDTRWKLKLIFEPKKDNLPSYPGCTAVTDLKLAFQYLKETPIDGVIVASPSNTHGELIQKLLAFKIPVFCEKPLETTYLRTKEIVECLEEKNIPLQVGFNRRFDPPLLEAVKKIREEDQRVEFIHLTSRDPYPPHESYLKNSGGILSDMSIHDFDLMRFISGSEVESLFVYGNHRPDSSLKKMGEFDSVLTSLSFENGALGSIHNTRQTPFGYDQRIEIVTNKERYLLGDPNDYFEFFEDRYKESYQLELLSFYNLIKGQNPDYQALSSDALKAIELSFLAEKSLKSHTPIHRTNK